MHRALSGLAKPIIRKKTCFELEVIFGLFAAVGYRLGMPTGQRAA
jgi:hypothetical protein